MTFTLTFSQKIDNQNVPYFIDGIEAQLRVEATDKTSAIYHELTKAYCIEHQVSVRRVS